MLSQKLFSKRLGLRLLIPSKSIVWFYHNIYKLRRKSKRMSVLAAAEYSATYVLVDFRSGQPLSAGTASASSEEVRFLRGLQTRAFPAGVGCPELQSTINNVDGCCMIRNKAPQPAKEIHVDSCGMKSIGETPQRVSARRLTSARGKRSVFPQRRTEAMPHFPSTSKKMKSSSRDWLELFFHCC